MTINQSLVILNVLAAVGIGWCAARNRGGIEVNHLLLFCAGFLFYWVSPVIIGLSGGMGAEALLKGWVALFNAIPPATLTLYLLFSLGFLLSFSLGSAIGARVRFGPRSALLRTPDLLDPARTARWLTQSASEVAQAVRAGVTDTDAAEVFGRGAEAGAEPRALLNALNRWIVAGQLPAEPDLPSGPGSRTGGADDTGPDIAWTGMDDRGTEAGSHDYSSAPSLSRMDGASKQADRRLTRLARATSDPMGAARQSPATPGAWLRRAALEDSLRGAVARRAKLRSAWEGLRFQPDLLLLFLVPAALLTATFAFALRADLFHGYVGGALQDNSNRGTFIACSVLLSSLALLYMCIRPRGSRAGRLTSHLSNPYVAAYTVAALLVLSMGGRLYFLSGICMLLVYWTVYHRRLSSRSFAITILAILAAAGAVGTIRMGGGLSLTAIAISLFAESIGTSISLISFLAAGRIAMWNAPVLLTHDFYNLIPTSLMPNKAALLLTPADLGYQVYAPLGAMHSATSFIINFGVLGSLMVVFAFGLWLAVLKRSRVPLFRVMYIMLSGWVAFTFFRDPFSISIVKTMFQFSLVVPVAISITAAVLHALLTAHPAQQEGRRRTTRLGGAV